MLLSEQIALDAEKLKTLPLIEKKSDRSRNRHWYKF